VKRLPPDVEEIASIMEMHDRAQGHHPDTETGEVAIIPEGLPGEDVLDDDHVADLPEWERELVEVAREIYADGDRYIGIPSVEANEVYHLMVEFADGVDGERLREQLSIALDGRGAFGRFKRILEAHPEDRKRWFRIRDAFMADRVREWLAEWDIEPLPGGEGSGAAGDQSSVPGGVER
jgi:hypothetical protein